VSPEESTVTEVEGHRLVLTNLSKVLYPEVGLTKGQVIAYYVGVAPVLLPHLRDRPVTFRRFPEGVDGLSFFEKNVPRGAPEWVRTTTVPKRSGDGRDVIVHVVIDDLATLVWTANLAALELHVPMWRVGAPGQYGLADLMVFDLDPGEPASVVECCRVAAWLRDLLEADGVAAFPKTSGSKGLQLYIPLDPPEPWRAVRDRSHEVAREVEREHPDLVVSNMRRDLRAARVLIDWSQNHAAKTTVAPYSLRARPAATVSTPVTWDEVAGCAESGDADRLVFDSFETLDRVATLGDLFSGILT
jgi:bifunctional non-homologous end joining protein LigD